MSTLNNKNPILCECDNKLSFTCVVIYDGMDNDGLLGKHIIQMAVDNIVNGDNIKMIYIPLDRQRMVMTNGLNQGGKSTDLTVFDVLPKDIDIIRMVDICLPFEEMERLNTLVKKDYDMIKEPFLCFDHHILSDELMSRDYIIHGGKDECGASTAWKYLFENEMPPLLLDVRDRDLFIKERPDTDKTFFGLMRASDNLIYLALNFQEFTNDIVELGREDYNKMQETINIVVSGTQLIKKPLHGFKIGLYVNIENHLISDAGNAWCKANPDAIFMSVSYDSKKKLYAYSLRSVNGTALKLAKMFPGGGGHPNACGFPHLEKLLWF